MTEEDVIEPKSLLERIVHSTVRITAQTAAGSSRGTGFFFNFPLKQEGQVVPTIITNKHVIKDSNSQTFLMNLHDPKKDEKGPTSIFNVNLQDTRLGHGWFEHPDPDVDLCCLP